ncbi:MAG: methylmalonyl Co-A mutase-associated GTPase MeaB [Desulfurococcales archaeon]|nr:methylmalonyl Co-A mutase-associated GTPase MeaB [Desulfurococcales archaeon]
MRDIIELFEEAKKGKLRAIGRLLTIVENSSVDVLELLEYMSSHGGNAQVIGITGIPGAGKSTLISKMIGEYRKQNYKVAVVAIDPSSPITQGSLMGDRLRMQQFATDRGVFIRSMSTRGLKGGLSIASMSTIEVFDALGYDKILVETVGVGQSDVDIMNAAHTIIVVTMPGAGDDIQALKAGVMEIGNIYVINKSDKPEASRTFEYLKFSLDKGDIGLIEKDWVPRIVKTSAIMGQGIKELVNIIEEHWNHVKSKGLAKEKLVSRRLLLSKLLLERVFSESLQESFRDLDGTLKKRIVEGKDYRSVTRMLAKKAVSKMIDRVDQS